MASNSDRKNNSDQDAKREDEPVGDPADKPHSIFGRHLPLERETVWFILFSVLDILLTYKLLSSGKVQEANPIARYFINRWGAKGMVYFKMGMVAFITVLAQVIAVRNRAAARWVLWFGIAIVGVVVVYSVSLVFRTGAMN